MMPKQTPLLQSVNDHSVIFNFRKMAEVLSAMTRKKKMQVLQARVWRNICDAVTYLPVFLLT